MNWSISRVIWSFRIVCQRGQDFDNFCMPITCCIMRIWDIISVFRCQVLVCGYWDQSHISVKSRYRRLLECLVTTGFKSYFRHQPLYAHIEYVHEIFQFNVSKVRVTLFSWPAAGGRSESIPVLKCVVLSTTLTNGYFMLTYQYRTRSNSRPLSNSRPSSKIRIEDPP